MHWYNYLGYVASAFAAGAFIMQRMIPLRLMIIVANILFIAYALIIGELILLAIHAALLPINLWRLQQMRNLVKRVERASDGQIAIDWLTQFMKRKHVRAGLIVFAKGEEANELFYVASGRFRLIEIQKDVEPGAVVGELGLLAPGNKRSMSLQCIEDGELLVASYDQVNELYFQNPEFGYYFLRLVASRLFADASAAKQSATRVRSS
ncbi:MAG: cyclic nucleotide-binding domain-containing protein [Beijerinckiaceae bacterium]|nr:cyclic nucleotide-binding domain-containing protein [Beijerinckiaceae bacterium]